MNAAPPYAFPPRALRRWRDERLTLTDEADGGLRAVFLFDGSTCGNIPFQLIYTALLAPAEEGHRLLELRCAPVSGDDGHKRMCSYLESGERLLDTLQTERPLIGQPLAEALAWQPATSPAGCVCAVSSRHHKWLAVLHTIHFALAQRAATPSVSP